MDSSDDMVLIESGSSMRLVSSPSSEHGTKNKTSNSSFGSQDCCGGICWPDDSFANNTTKRYNPVDFAPPPFPSGPESRVTTSVKERPRNTCTFLPPPPQLAPLPTDVLTPADLIPVRYSGKPLISTGHIARITPFQRNVLVLFHSASSTDFEEYVWILKYGVSESWYTKPSLSRPGNQDTLRASGQSPSDMPAVDPARPVSLETPKVWAAAALVTPIDDDVYDCEKEHGGDADGSEALEGAYLIGKAEKSKALSGTSLVYCVVLSTCQASDPFVHGAHFNGKTVFRVVRCGTREGAAAEAYYAVGVNGWSVVFSCVFRKGETFTEKFKRVEQLWELGEEDGEMKEGTKVFY